MTLGASSLVRQPRSSSVIVLIPELVRGVSPFLAGQDPMGDEVDCYANTIDIGPSKDLQEFILLDHLLAARPRCPVRQKIGEHRRANSGDPRRRLRG